MEIRLQGRTTSLWFSGNSTGILCKEDVIDFFKDFHQQGRFVKSLNSTFLVLIPKKEGSKDIKDFKPISLVGSLYKLLPNRLKKVMSRLVNLSQNAFVEGR